MTWRLRKLYHRLLENRIAVNTSLQIANQALTAVTSIVIFALVARALGATEYGRFALATTVASLILIITDAGLDVHIVNALARNRVNCRNEPYTRELVLEAVGLRAGLWFIAVVALGAAVLITGSGYAWLIAAGVLSLGSTLSSVGMLFTDVFHARQNLWPFVVSSAAGKVVSMSLVAIAYVTNFLYFESLVILTALGGILSLSVALKYAVREGLHRGRLNLRRSIGLYRRTATLAAFVILGQVVHRADVLILAMVGVGTGQDATNKALGIYAAAYRIFELSLLLPGLLTNSLAPSLAFLAEHERPMFWTFLRTWGLRFMAIGVCATIGVYATSSFVVELVAGDAFTDSSRVLRLLCFAIPLAFATALLFSGIVALGAQWVLVPLYSLVAIGNVVLNFAIIPIYGYVGCAVVTVISQGMLAVGMVLILRHKKASSIANSGSCVRPNQDEGQCGY